MLTDFLGENTVTHVGPDASLILKDAQYKPGETMEESFTKYNELLANPPPGDCFYNTLFCVIDWDAKMGHRSGEQTPEEKIIYNLSKYYNLNVAIVVLSHNSEDYNYSKNLSTKGLRLLLNEFDNRVLLHCEKHNKLQSNGKKQTITEEAKTALLREMFDMMIKMKEVKVGAECYK